MKKILIIICLFIMGIALNLAYTMGENSVIEKQIIYSGDNGIYYSSYDDEIHEYHYEENNCTSLKEVSNFIQDDEILVKQNGNIIFNGKNFEIPDDISSLEVIEIESCDDTEYTTTIFVK